MPSRLTLSVSGAKQAPVLACVTTHLFSGAIDYPGTNARDSARPVNSHDQWSFLHASSGRGCKRFRTTASQIAGHLSLSATAPLGV
jgi:hypothetical protein